MERSQLFDLMGELQLYGMKAAFDEIMTTAVKRRLQPPASLGLEPLPYRPRNHPIWQPPCARAGVEWGYAGRR
jgi:hypothetical protein